MRFSLTTSVGLYVNYLNSEVTSARDRLDTTIERIKSVGSQAFLNISNSQKTWNKIFRWSFLQCNSRWANLTTIG